MVNLSIIIPCYNEFKVAEVVKEFELYNIEVIIVDDGSDIPIPQATVRHEKNKGYGAALKTGIRHATRDWIITMDGDGQHQAIDVIRLWLYHNLIEHYDMVVGVRKIKEVGKLRVWGRAFLNLMASILAGIWLPDLNSGLRIFRKDLALKYEKILCDTYSFTTSLTLMFLIDGYKVEWMPIEVQKRSQGKSKVNVLKHGCVTLYYILRIGLALRTRRIREFIRIMRHKC